MKCKIDLSVFSRRFPILNWSFTQPSRRALIRSTAWAVPAVSVVSVAVAAPAFATSCKPGLSFSAFDVAPVLGQTLGNRFFDLDFRRLTISAEAVACRNT